MKTKIAGRAIEVLHVEDNLGDATLLKQVVKTAGFPMHLHAVPNGEEAIAFLKQENPHSSAPRPDVILLDLKLPRKSGMTVLTEIRQNSQWANLPVIVLTNSESDLDMDWATRLNAKSYMVKPMELQEFGKLVDMLREIWIKTFQKHRPS